MTERIDMLGGEFNIDSAIGEGTKVVITLPAPNENQDTNS
ncbi:hypothetical protein J416_00314 [Gracilibacillus halophilus YIM-C55.5]|uniref:Two-component sensor histidine kinase n=1 Tax=Gracilibacillus halophilus YIM-C55.5 TaxID=1308866 RepID=N4WGK1_9BACI|nr:hypothetical protein J416_00314 [Gracilibacillus halophilus YIM-C55.5]